MKYILIFLAFFCEVPCYAYSMKMDSLGISVGEKEIGQQFVTIENETNDTLFLWIDTLTYTEDNKDEYIRRFMTKRRGDISIFQIINEANIIYPERFWFFIKALFPKERFTFVVTRDTENDHQAISNEQFLNSIRAFTKCEINSAFQNLIDEHAFKILSEVLSYPQGYIVIPNCKTRMNGDSIILH